MAFKRSFKSNPPILTLYMFVDIAFVISPIEHPYSHRNNPTHGDVNSSGALVFEWLFVSISVYITANIAKIPPGTSVVYVQHFMGTNHTLHGVHSRPQVLDILGYCNHWDALVT